MSRVLATRVLICHEETPCAAIAAVGAQIALADDHGWDIEFVAVGRPGDLIVPAPALALHTDGLWRTTCFELFIALAGDGYVEINLSPSGAFAAYHFDHYRTGMRALAIPAPAITVVQGSERLTLTAHLPEDSLPWDRSGRIGLAAVIEDRSGCTSYWALAHGAGRPDFHQQDCFAATLPPVERR